MAEWLAVLLSNRGSESVSDSFSLLVGHFFSYWVASSSLYVMVRAWSYRSMFCPFWLMPLGGLLFSEERWKGLDLQDRGGGEGREWRGEVGKTVVEMKYM